jgi:hypothetical protein
MFSVTSIFVNLSETMAELGFLVSNAGQWRHVRTRSAMQTATRLIKCR